MRDKRNIEALILLARADLRLDKPDEAKQAAEAAIAIEPNNALAHAELGLALAMTDDVRGGYRELDVAQKLARNQLPEAHRNRAVIAMREGKLSVAENELKQAVLFRPTDVNSSSNSATFTPRWASRKILKRRAANTRRPAIWPPTVRNRSTSWPCC